MREVFNAIRYVDCTGCRTYRGSRLRRRSDAMIAVLSPSFVLKRLSEVAPWEWDPSGPIGAPDGQLPRTHRPANGYPLAPHPGQRPKTQPQFSKSFKVFDAVNFGTRDALSIISRPVCGLRALRALRLATLNVPKPGRRTSWPSFMVFSMCLITASTATPALSLDSSVASATASIKSFLLIFCGPRGFGNNGARQDVWILPRPI